MVSSKNPEALVVADECKSGAKATPGTGDEIVLLLAEFLSFDGTARSSYWPRNTDLASVHCSHSLGSAGVRGEAGPGLVAFGLGGASATQSRRDFPVGGRLPTVIVRATPTRPVTWDVVVRLDRW